MVICTFLLVDCIEDKATADRIFVFDADVLDAEKKTVLCDVTRLPPGVHLPNIPSRQCAG